MTLYQRYKKLNLDLAQLGLEPGNARSDYFCTPKGAKVIGWEGVDGIHYCLIKGLDDMVFAVNPSNLPGDHVHPLARSFEDFLRLLLACGSAAAVEQAHLWDREQFDAFVEEYPPPPEQRVLLDALAEQLSLAPMEDPYGYIRAVQAEFDYSRIPYRKDYYDCVPEEPKVPGRPEWKVYFEGGSSPRRGRPGQEVPIHQTFTWEGRVWHIPAVYLCGQGLVMDLCMEVDPGQLRTFLDKWAPRLQEGRTLTPEEEELLEAENPQTFEYTPKLTVNGKELHREHGRGFGWVPVSCRENYELGMPARQDWGAIWHMEHYGLDPERGWWFTRECFPWGARRKPTLRTLTLHMTQNPQPVPGPRFTVRGAGDEVPFTHPATGAAHTLRVLEYEEQEISGAHLPDGWEHPTHCTVITYEVEPDIPESELMVRDCGQGDSSRIKSPDSSSPEACAIGIIGGVDGPTAILLASPRGSQPRSAVSALRFAPPEEIQWRMVFYRRMAEDLNVDLPLPAPEP